MTRRVNEVNALISCGCGCQETFFKYDKYGRERRYIVGHGNKGKKVFSKGERICLIDPTHETALNELGNEHWFRYKEGYVCSRCAMKLIYYQKYKHKDRKRIRFKNSRPKVEGEYKTGKCDLCGKKIGDSYVTKKGKTGIIKSMHTHHFEYHDDDILKDTIQICPQCHGRESARLRKEKRG